MSELNLNPSRSYDAGDQVQNVQMIGATNDLTPFTMALDLHYHDRCTGISRDPGILEDAKKTADAFVNQGAKIQGAEFTGDELIKTLQTPEGRGNFQSAVQAHVEEILDRFCLQADGVEIRQVKTKDH